MYESEMFGNSYKVVTRKPKQDRARAYSHSIITAIKTCPTWGVIRYGHRKIYPSKGRAMALEAGSAMHEVFAALRVHQLYRWQDLPEHGEAAGIAAFGRSRWANCFEKRDDYYDEAVNLAFNILHSGTFEDNPDDRIRTIAHMEEGILKYVTEHTKTMHKWDVWVADVGDPSKPLGVEQAFDVDVWINDKKVRYIGTVDGVYEHKQRGIHLGENKYVARLDNAWRQSFDMSYQLTGYMLAIRAVVGLECLKARVIGLKNKMAGKVEDHLDFVALPRSEEMFNEFIEWVHRGADIMEEYIGDWENADKYTHSCSRYFRPCALLPLCTDDRAGRVEQFNEMVLGELSPSEQAVLEMDKQV